MRTEKSSSPFLESSILNVGLIVEPRPKQLCLFRAIPQSLIKHLLLVDIWPIKIRDIGVLPS